MTDTEKLINKLETLRSNQRDTGEVRVYDIVLIEEAISSIKELSAKYDKAVADVIKLSAQDKWIPCRERLPYDSGEYTVTAYAIKRVLVKPFDVDVSECYGEFIAIYHADTKEFEFDDSWESHEVVAWRKSEPYKGE